MTTDEKKLMNFIKELQKAKDKQLTGKARAKLFLNDAFEETIEEKADKRQRKFEEITHENFQTIYDTIYQVWSLLAEFYERHEGKFVEKEKIEKIFADSEKIINEIVEGEKKTIDRLKKRLIAVIKEHANEKKLYERRRRMYEKWTKRHIDRYNDFADLIVTYRNEVAKNNELTRHLNDEIERYNKKISDFNESHQSRGR